MDMYERQYELVKAHATSQYPDADCISYRRSSFNMIWATVEGEDFHVDLTYMLGSHKIIDWWARSRKNQKCTSDCLHGMASAKQLYREREARQHN